MSKYFNFNLHVVMQLLPRPSLQLPSTVYLVRELVSATTQIQSIIITVIVL